MFIVTVGQYVRGEIRSAVATAVDGWRDFAEAHRKRGRVAEDRLRGGRREGHGLEMVTRVSRLAESLIVSVSVSVTVLLML